MLRDRGRGRWGRQAADVTAVRYSELLKVRRDRGVGIRV